jgi:single-strand DNA-binding protein
MLIGNLGRDAETRHTPSGVAVTNFSIATARRVKDQSGEWRDETDWHDIVLWRGENVAPYLLKGTQVYIEGRLQTRSWDDQSGQKKYRTEVVVDGNMGLMLLSGGGRGEGGGGGRPSGGGAGRPSGPADDDMAIGDDDVPF